MNWKVLLAAVAALLLLLADIPAAQERRQIFEGWNDPSWTHFVVRLKTGQVIRYSRSQLSQIYYETDTTTGPPPSAPGGAPATRETPSSTTPSSGTGIEGRWAVNFNNYQGTAQFTRGGSGWTGSLSLDAGPEPLANITFDSRTGAVSFVRTSVGQHYTGKLTGNRMSGLFDDAYAWSATRTGR